MTRNRTPVWSLQLLAAVGVGLLGLSAVLTPAWGTAPNPAAPKAGWREKFVLPHPYPAVRVAVSAGWVATADDRGSLYFWKAATGERDRKSGLYQIAEDQLSDTIDRLAFTLDGSALVWVFNGGTGYGELNPDTIDGHTTRAGPAAVNRRLDYSPDGDWCLDRSADDPKVLFVMTNGWKFKRGNTTFLDGVACGSEVKLAAGSADNKSLAIWTAAGELIVRDVESKKNRHTIPLKGRTLTAVRFSPDGKQLAAIGADKLLTVFDTTSGKPVTGFAAHAGDVLDVTFTPDGQRLLTVGDDHTARIWDVATGKPLAVLRGHTDRVTGVACGPDGKTLATASADRTAKVWAWAE